MKEYGMAAYLIVSDDFHASEYVGEYFKCREYISGFNGSAGTLVITEDMAGLWTDGRYFIMYGAVVIPCQGGLCCQEHTEIK